MKENIGEWERARERKRGRERKRKHPQRRKNLPFYQKSASQDMSNEQHFEHFFSKYSVVI